MALRRCWTRAVPSRTPEPASGRRARSSGSWRRCTSPSSERAGWVLCSPPMLKLIAKWVLSASALLFVAYVYHGVEVSTFTSALLAALVIGLLNAFVRPVLVVLTLPVTVLTLGLFLFVINALVFWAASALLEGFFVRNFLAALIGSVLYTLVGMVIESALERLFAHK